MAVEKSPAFQFYPKDFLTDSHVIVMTLQEVGAYIRLLCICWLDHSLPTDMDALARLCRVSPACFTRLWPALQPCFTVVDGRLIQGRMERERQKQETYRALKSEAGKKGGRPKSIPKAHVKQAESKSQTKESPPSSSSFPSSVSDLHSSKAAAEPMNARSKRPIYTSDRFAVFEWQLDDLERMLGAHADAFDLHAFFDRLSQQSRALGVVIPSDRETRWRWLQVEVEQEARRRGLPMAVTEAPALGKQSTRLAAALASIKAAEV